MNSHHTPTHSRLVLRSFFAMVKARTMEFVRDRGTFFWNLLFPLLLVFGFAFAFSGDADPLFRVAYQGSLPQEFSLLDVQGVQGLDYNEREESREEILELLRRHQMEMFVDFTAGEYFINSESPSAEILGMLMDTALAGPGAPGLREARVSGEPIRYVDWLVPGVIGMNMMFSCLFGVGFVLVRYRKNGVLKRMKATPVSALTFVSAQALSRFVIVILTSIVVFAGTNLFLSFMMQGSWLLLLLVTALGILCMIALGLVFASRLRSEELASGLLNLVTFPMLILSGVFFSLEDAPNIVRGISRVFPLTHFIDAARSVMLDGAGLLEILPSVLYMGGLTVVLLLLSALMFRWE